MAKVKLSPQKAKPQKPASDAWWYENRNSIDVLIDDRGVVASCRINRKALADWLRRTEAKNG